MPRIALIMASYPQIHLQILKITFKGRDCQGDLRQGRPAGLWSSALAIPSATNKISQLGRFMLKKLSGGAGMVKFSTAEAREKLGMIIQRAAVEKERIVLTRRGKELAALVPIEDMRFLEELEDRLDLEEARAALAEAKADPERPIPWEKLKAELGL
jgi:prevent-host-death family protein